MNPIVRELHVRKRLPSTMSTGVIVYFVTLLFLALFPLHIVHAAALSLDPKAGSFGPGDTFVVSVRLELEPEECVNAATVELAYPTEWMKASAVSKGESLLTLWPGEPLVDHARGIVSFSGGIPAGYCGRVQGDPGKTNILGKIIFSIPGNMIGGKAATSSVPLTLSFGPNTSVLQNDGFGTPASLTLHTGTYVRTQTSGSSKNEWLDIVHADTFPPEIFSAAIAQDPQTFQGKFFLVFSTVDKQSGVHHYEVMEDDPFHFGRTRGTKEQAIFKNAISPYVLHDQELGSRIIVRAIDQAGNVQETIVAPKGDYAITKTVQPGGAVSVYWWIGFGTLLALLIVGIVLLRRKKPEETEHIKL